MTHFTPFQLVCATIEGQAERQNWTLPQKLELAEIVFDQLKNLDRCNLDASISLIGCAGTVRYIDEMVISTDDDGTMRGFFDELVFAYPSQKLHPNGTVTNSFHYIGMNWHNNPYARANLIEQIHNKTLFNLLFDSGARRALQSMNKERA